MANGLNSQTGENMANHDPKKANVKQNGQTEPKQANESLKWLNAIQLRATMAKSEQQWPDVTQNGQM